MLLNSLHSIKIIENHQYIFLLAIVAVGFFVRVLRFRKKGQFTWDEAAYYREAQNNIAIFGFLKKNLFRMLRTKRAPEKKKELFNDYIKEVQSYQKVVFFKSWHTYLNHISICIFGHKDYSAAVPSLLIGTSEIAVVFFLGKIMFGPMAGLLAALFLSLSGMHILNSRSSGPEVRTAMCYLLIVIFSVGHKLLFSGHPATISSLFQPESLLLLIGAGFFICGTICFNPCWLMLFPFLFFISDGIFAIVSNSISIPAFIVSQFIVFLSAAIFYMITDIPYLILQKYIPEAKIGTGINRLKVSTLELIKYSHVRVKQEDRGEFIKPPKWHWLYFYPELLLHSEGIAVFMLSVAGIGLLVLRHSPLNLFIAFQGAFVWAFVIFAPYKSARTILPLVPLFCLYAGIAAAALPIYILVPLVAYISVRALIYASRIVKLTSGIKSAAEFINEQGSELFLCTSAPFVLLYGPPDVVPVSPSDFGVIYTYYMEGFDFLVVDHHLKFPGIASDSFINYIEDNITPVFSAEDPAITFFPIKAECEYFSPGDFHIENKLEAFSIWNDFITNSDQRNKMIRVYDMRIFFKNEKFLLDHPTSLFYFASMKFKEQKYKEALAMFQRALSMNDSPIYRLHIGVCHLKLGRKELAKKILLSITSDESLMPDIRSMVDYFLAEC